MDKWECSCSNHDGKTPCLNHGSPRRKTTAAQAPNSPTQTAARPIVTGTTAVVLSEDGLLETEKTHVPSTCLMTGQTTNTNNAIEKELRVVVIGKSRNGKSATGNTLLGKNSFESRISTTPVTEICKIDETCVDGRTLVVTDSPGIFFDDMPKDKMEEEMQKIIASLVPGPHIFLFVLGINKFDNTEIEILEMYKKAFGEEIMNYLIVVFTGRDQLEQEGMGFKEYFNALRDKQKKIFKECGDRVYAINNKALEAEKASQARELLKLMLELKQKNGGKYYTNEVFQACFEQSQKEISKQKDKHPSEDDAVLRRWWRNDVTKGRLPFGFFGSIVLGFMAVVGLALLSK